MEDRKYRHWMLTWNKYESLSLPEEILDKSLKELCDSYVYQVEKGEKTGTVHLQGYLCTKIRKRQKSLLNDLERICQEMTASQTVVGYYVRT